MTFEEILAHVIEVLRREGRVSYRALQRRFDLDDAYLEDLRVELIEAKQLARDENGRILVWAEQTATTTSPAAGQEAVRGSRPMVQMPREAPVHDAPDRPEPERRQLTVLFCDLVDSTRLARQLDPEDLRDIIRAYQASCVSVIERFAGHVAQYLGDGLLVYFGYPEAHEDDAQRAVRAGLGILDAMATVPSRLLPDTSARLAVRIGIHTGLVVVGEIGSGGRQEHLALGDTPNVAARLQGLAAPNTMVISEVTARLVHGYFVCQPLGMQTVKGLETPVHVFQVTEESAVRSRLDIAGSTGLTPLVGREAEVTLLRERWAQTTQGLGQVVLITGEPGIGKSRLVRVLTERVVEARVLPPTLRCSPYHTNSALYPVIEHLQRVLHWHRDAAPEARLATLEEVLQTAGLPLAEAVPLVAALLSLPAPAHYPPLSLSPQRQKQQTLEVLVAWLLAATAQEPLLSIWEDLHWADPSTLELLGLVLDQAPTARLLLVLTARPAFRPPWTPRSYITPLALTRLLGSQVEELVLRITGGKALPAEVLRQIVEKTDGVPLFVEELVKMILEAGLVREDAGGYGLNGPLPPLAIPTTLQDALMARLDRLAAVKTVAQVAAVLGREFSYPLLRAVAPGDETTLQHGLSQLIDAELLYQRGRPPQATYVFKHALVQDVAYQSLLRSTRQRYHQRIAEVLEAQFPDTAATQPELLAQHHTEAGLAEQAIVYWQRAGERALQRSANVEAIHHLVKGLELLRTLPETYERDQRELGLQLTLGPALMAAKGQAAPEARRAYTRACELGQRLGATRQHFQALWGSWRSHFVESDHRMGRELGEQCLRLAEESQDVALMIAARFALGGTLVFRGELAAGRHHLELAVPLYDIELHRPLAFHYGQDPGASTLAYLSWTEWYLGFPERALHRGDQALALAQAVGHPLTHAFVLLYLAMSHVLRREWSAARSRAETAIQISNERGFPQTLWYCSSIYARTFIEEGHLEPHLTQLQEAVNARKAIGVTSAALFERALLAEAYGLVNRVEDGLGVLGETIDFARRTGEGFHLPELHRLKGTLLLGQSSDNRAEAEACFAEALEVARHQRARSLELRAAMSLARSWLRQGRRAEAYALLGPIHDWFTEGFDTADLRDARTLLAELGRDGR